MLQIGPLTLPGRAVLAPLAGISDLPYRLINRRMGCPLAHIEMISVHGLNYRNRKTAELIRTLDEDKPLGIQLFGREPEAIAAAMDYIADRGFALVDFNAACPVRKVVRRGEGAALMREPEHLGLILREMVKRSNAPVTLKIRIGWDHAAINARDIALIAEDAGVAAVSIHGRTRAQLYTGQADYAPIAEAVKAVRIPVLASGDIMGPMEALRAMQETGCAGVMVARGGLGNPWIFREIEAALEGRALPPRPGVAEIAAVMREHFRLTVEQYGESVSHKVYRKNFIWYTRGMGWVKPLRQRAVTVRTASEMFDVINEFENTAMDPALHALSGDAIAMPGEGET